MFLEQVVPSCSPFAVADEEKPSAFSQQHQSQEKLLLDTVPYFDKHKENVIPCDEKPPIHQPKEENKLVGGKRQKRTMDHVINSTNVKPINFLKGDDDIFD